MDQDKYLWSSMNIPQKLEVRHPFFQKKIKASENGHVQKQTDVTGMPKKFLEAVWKSGFSSIFRPFFDVEVRRSVGKTGKPFIL